MSTQHQTLTVRIRSPNLSLPDDYIISVDQNATFADVKSLLMERLGINSTFDELLMIYQGRILSNTDSLSQVLKDTHVLQTIHLVVKSQTSQRTSHLVLSSEQPLMITEHYTYYRATHQGVNCLVQVPNAHPFIPSSTALNTVLHGQWHSPNTSQPTTPPVQPQQDQNLQQQQQERLQRSTHFWLLARLAFFAYIFSQNASLGRMLAVHLSALVIFLYQTGRLSFLNVWWTFLTQRQTTGQNQQVTSIWYQIEHALFTFITSLIPNTTNHQAADA